ncbi:MAG: type I DNA topoisomerase [Lachnospiraceae bacterium]
MAKNLVIVESPAKVKTIKKFLGSNYQVVASNGHVRDLPKSQLGIDVEHNYEPKYITIRGKGELLAALRKEVRKADKVYLATDPDREGEAISWHLYHVLKLENKKVYRIAFNEITKNAVKESIKNAREIDMNLVNAQQARRMLDRMMGYRISPVLWKKVKRGLSAGRVQSVALRMVADREEEINTFIPEEYWSLDALLRAEGMRGVLKAKFYGTKDERIAITSKEQMDQVLEQLRSVSYVVSEIKKSDRIRRPPAPFTTSTLQQEASKQLNFATQKTMRVAQQLYEGIDIRGNGTVGVITYLRTDSVRVSEEAQVMTREYITQNYGGEYVQNGQGSGSNKGKKVQDAHEAIRPTDVFRTPAMLKDSLTRDQFRLYQLIWKRFVASQMSAARYETTSVKIDAGEYRFTVQTSKLVFDGFKSVYVEPDEEKEGATPITGLEQGQQFQLEDLDAQQHFTQPPAHYTEAALVKAMEELSIGRPSTYAPTITTLVNRRYVAKEGRTLYITELGEAVNSIMLEAFPSIVDVNFTANMEALLDKIEEGVIDWKTVIENFYPDLDEAVQEAEEKLAKVDIADEVSDVQCEECGRMMVIKYGPHGRFLACPGFPECRNTKPYLEKVGVACPKCGGAVVLRKTKKGRKFYGCENSPECDFMSWQKPSGKNCPKCGQALLEKGKKLVCMNAQCGYVEERTDMKDSEN